MIAALLVFCFATYLFLAWRFISARQANNPLGGYLGIYTRYNRMRDWADDAADLLELLLERDKARAQSATNDDERFSIEQWVARIEKQLEPCEPSSTTNFPMTLGRYGK